MASVSDLRQGLATRLATIPGLRAAATAPDAPRPPQAIVMPDRIDYDLSMARGADRFFFTIILLVSRADDRAAQNNLDAYITGPSSIKAAIEGDRTLGGKADTCRVTQMRNYAAVSVGEVLYLGAEFDVEVVA